jgi:hypothetical protein
VPVVKTGSLLFHLYPRESGLQKLIVYSTGLGLVLNMDAILSRQGCKARYSEVNKVCMWMCCISMHGVEMMDAGKRTFLGAGIQILRGVRPSCGSVCAKPPCVAQVLDWNEEYLTGTGMFRIRDIC